MKPAAEMNILVVGAGGREHALCWKLAASTRVKQIYCAPGNGGTALNSKTKNVHIQVDEFQKLAEFSQANNIDLIVIGPDNPLAQGIVDFLQQNGLTVFGPSKSAARLEWSKTFAKDFMLKHGLPTARFLKASDHDSALKLARENDWARVVKYDGLALGKGVFVCDSQQEVIDALAAIYVKKTFGERADVLLEERLVGEEMSLLFFCDGERLVEMPACQDHKRRYDGDTGPNTGGMGAYCPVELYSRCAQRIEEEVTAPLQKALRSAQIDYKGVLYAGLLVDEQNKPYVLEFNARFGDPETQALMPLLDSDLAEILWSCTQGQLSATKVKWKRQASCCVVAAARQYPASSSQGETIEIGHLPPHCQVFHAGTALADGGLVTAGGRVLAVTAVAPDMAAARLKSYAALEKISFAGMDYRKDIARRATKQCLSS